MRDNVFVLADDYSDSGNRLARYLQCGVSSNVRNMPETVMWVVRYGLTTAIHRYSRTHPVSVINDSCAIQNAANKYRALQILEENGIRIPRFSRNYTDILNCPKIFRKDYHSQGRGLIILNNYGEYYGNEEYFTGGYFMQMIDVDKEYRTLIFNGQCIGVDRKNGGESITSDFIRNIRNGWNFISLSKERNPVTYRRIGRVGIESVQALGLHFGAVDILKDRRGRLYVLEVNTAPGLRVGKAKRLAQHILHYIGEI